MPSLWGCAQLATARPLLYEAHESFSFWLCNDRLASLRSKSWLPWIHARSAQVWAAPLHFLLPLRAVASLPATRQTRGSMLGQCVPTRPFCNAAFEPACSGLPYRACCVVLSATGRLLGGLSVCRRPATLSRCADAPNCSQLHGATAAAAAAAQRW